MQYPPAQYPPTQRPPAQQPSAGYPPAQYPAAGQQPIYPPVAPPLAPRRASRIPHPAIFGFAVLGLLCVFGYSLVLLFQFRQTGSTGIAPGSPLIVLNAVLYAGDLIGGFGATIGLVVTAAQMRATGWMVAGIIGLVVMVFTIGIFSIVALVPAWFYALYGPKKQAGAH
jgi:hypothetical protein